MDKENSASQVWTEQRLKEHTMRRFNMSEADWAKEKQALSQRVGEEVSDSDLSMALELGFA